MGADSSSKSSTLERFAKPSEEPDGQESQSNNRSQSERSQEEVSEPPTIPIEPDEKTRRAQESTTQDSLGDSPSRYDSKRATEAAQQRQEQAEEDAEGNRPDEQETLTDTIQSQSDGHASFGTSVNE